MAKMSRYVLSTALLALVSCVAPRCVEAAAHRVVVVLGAEAPELERFAAQELAAQFRRLFDADVTIANKPPDERSFVVLLGSPETNPAIKAHLDSAKPAPSEQRILLRSLSTDRAAHGGLLVAGGSPRATLWAVYELGYRFGIRYLLREDIYPQTPLAMTLDDIDVEMEPDFRTRSWRTINDFALGPESWPLADHKRLLGQLAKMKFNRVMLSVYPWQPYVHYEYAGVKKQTAMLWYGERYEIPGDAPGRTALGDVTVFENPDFAGKTTYEELTAAGIRQARGILDEAHRLGMTAAISISPLEFPREFAQVLPGAQTSRGLKDLLVAPGAGQRFDDDVLKQLVATKIRAYLHTYPQLDALYLTLPEFPEWDAQLQDAWAELERGLGADHPTLDDLLRAASKRSLVATGERGMQSLKGNIVGLAFLRKLFADAELLRRPDGRQVELVITAIDPELYPLLDRMLPAGARTLNFVDYTARRVAENREYLARVPADKVNSGLIMTLADDNVGVLSQSATRRLETLVSELRSHGWDGFSTRYWMLTEMDPAIHFLSRASWDRNVTARSAHDELFTTITGKQAVADRLWLALGHIEQATELIDRNDLGFGFPVQGMLLKHHQPQPVPEWWDELNEHYTQAMIDLYRSHDGTHPRARPLLFYWAKRSEYVLEYLSAVKALREAAIAEKAGDREKASEQLETALEQLYNAIDTLGDVPRDPSDRGLIAVLNAYAFRPLAEKYDKLSGE